MNARNCLLAVLFAGSLSLSQYSAAGVVFTINSTDKHTGESLGSTEVLVEGPLLKMTALDSDRDQGDGGSASDAVVDAGDTAFAGESAMAAAGAMVSGNAPAGPAADTGRDGEMVFDASKKQVTVVDAESREYYVVDTVALAQLREQFAVSQQPMNQMNAMLKQAYEQARANLNSQNMTPQERAAAEQMLRNTMGISEDAFSGGAADEVEMIKGEDDTINGFPVTWYHNPRGGSVAIADWDDLGPGAKTEDTFREFFEFMDAMGQGGFQSDSGFLKAIGEGGGFPVAGRSPNVGDEDAWELESVTERDIDPDAFEPPAGYRLRTMGGFFQ